MDRTCRHLSTQIKSMTILHCIFTCSTPYLFPFEHYDSNSFVLHNPVDVTICWTYSFILSPVSPPGRFWRGKQLPRSPLSLSPCRPRSPPTHFSLLASVRRFEGNHKYLITSFDKYSFRTYYVSGILLVTRCSIEPDTHSPHPQGAWRPLESNISLYEVGASSCQALGSLCTLSHWNLLEAAIPTVLILQGRRRGLPKATHLGMVALGLECRSVWCHTLNHTSIFSPASLSVSLTHTQSPSGSRTSEFGVFVAG